MSRKQPISAVAVQAAPDSGGAAQRFAVERGDRQAVNERGQAESTAGFLAGLRAADSGLREG